MADTLTTSSGPGAEREHPSAPRPRRSTTSSPTGCTRSLRMAELVYAAAERYPDLLPTRAEIDAERELPQKDKQGLEIDQGIFFAHVLAHPRCGPHLHARDVAAEAGGARRASTAFRRTGTASTSAPIRVDREGEVGGHHHPEPRVPELRGRPVDRGARDRRRPGAARRRDPRSACCAAAPRRIRSTPGGASSAPGINLTHLYYGKISLVEFMLERELGAREQDVPRARPSARPTARRSSDRREKPWIAAVESFAIGGALPDACSSWTA